MVGSGEILSSVFFGLFLHHLFKQCTPAYTLVFHSNWSSRHGVYRAPQACSLEESSLAPELVNELGLEIFVAHVGWDLHLKLDGIRFVSILVH